MRAVKFKKYIPAVYIDVAGKEHSSLNAVRAANKELNVTGNPPIDIKEGTQCYSDYVNEGVFHAWSTEGDESETNPVAIIEIAEGNIVTVLATHVKFVDNNEN